jgi:hypothetical protein
MEMKRKLFAIVAFTLAAGATAAPLTYDPYAPAKRDAMARLIVRTTDCMRQAVQARLAAGSRDDNDVAAWAAQVCGVALGNAMMADMGMSKTDAATYLFAMGHAALRETPGVGR